MSKVKKRFQGCKEKGERIASILAQKNKTADVTEFSNTIKFVNSVLDDFVKSKDKERPPVPDDGVKIEALMKAYEDLLNQLISTGRFLRFFTSNRVRKNLDQINSQLHKEVSQIFLGLQGNRRSSKKATKKISKAELESERQTECIKDDEGRQLWEINFFQTLMVDWNEFIRALQKVIQVTDESSKQLKYILDNSNTGFVSMYKFSDFLSGFGPLKLCIEKVQGVLNAEWFHGFLSSVEAERLLERQSPGTFLIRFSKSKPGSFAIAYVDANARNTVTHTLITCSPPSGFKIEEAYNRSAKGRLFVTLQEVVEFYSYILKAPFRSDLSRQSWFHGDLSSQEAEEILAGEKDGTFLFRFSSKPGFLAVSYLNANEVKHGLLETLPGGYKFDNQPPVYPTLQDVVVNLGDLLKIPLTTLTFDKRPGGSINISTIRITAEQSPLGQDQQYTRFDHLLKQPSGLMPAVTTLRPESPSPFTQQPPPQLVIPNTTPILPPPSFIPPPSSSSASANVSPYGNMPHSLLTGSTAPPSVTSPRASVPINTYGSLANLTSASASDNQYGSMPDSSSSSSPSTSSTLSMKPVSAESSSHSNQYGSMPIPPTSSVASGPSSNQYGSMPIPAPSSGSPSNGQYGSMPIPSSSSSSEYSSMPHNITSATSSPSPANTSQSEYGTMPSQGAHSGPNDNYGKMPQVVNGGVNSSSPSSLQYGKMPIPNPNAVSSPSQPPPSSSPSSSAFSQPASSPLSQSQYGTIPNAQPTPAMSPNVKQTGTGSPVSPRASQYLKMPPVQQTPNPQFNKMPPPVSAPSSSPSNSLNAAYGKMPIPVTPAANPSLKGSIPAKTSSPARTSSPAPSSSSPSNQYGKMPIPTTPNGPSATPPSNGHTKPLSASGPPVFNGSSNQYGKMPTPQLNATTPSSSSPSSSSAAPSNAALGRSSPTAQYGKMPIPQLNGGNAAPIKAAAKAAYGELPAKQSSDPRTAPAKSQSFTGSSPNPPSQPYGKVPLRGSGGIPPPVSSPSPSSPSSSPVLGNRSSSNYPVPVRAGGAERTAEHSEYGGLPDDNSDYGGLPEENADYGGLPGSENDPDYGGLPQQENDVLQQDNDYGGLPQQDNDYGGLPQQDNDYSGLPLSSQGAVLPHDNIRVPFGVNKSAATHQDSDYSGLPSAPSTSSPPSSPARSQYGGMPSRNNQRMSLHRSPSNQ